MKNKWLLIAMSALIVVFLSACSGDSDNSATGEEGKGGKDTYTLKFPHIVPTDHPAHKAALVFKEEVEEKSDGRVKVEVFANGELYGSDREIIEAIQLGNADVSMVGTPSLGTFDERFYVLDLPFLFATKEEPREALAGDLGKELSEGLGDINLKGLGYGYDGFRHVLNNKRPITKPEDMKGLKIRVQESEIQQDIFNTLGANASPLAFGELYSALQQKTYDGMDNSLSLIDSSKFYEVQKYLTLTSHQYSGLAILFNNKLFEDMPADIQDIIIEAGKDTEADYYQFVDEDEESMANKFQTENLIEVTELTPEEREKFIEVVQPVYKKYEDVIGKDLIDLAKSYSK
ncbi:C4-dicarboxylate ABC transporter substrate-binding protein [Sporosarcina sp. PTS2304]|uniref:TRAP transporter substrate-binding protein n=1 Tax=Sporosarcina sp. PTS2304 TaxID=2283194 RepID=UPI000E0D4BA5|nr:TRAP transporter substrate-binding protein [Sporosarcina sp. PTS2304]AXI01219.1 C4-dicarboxylate ABC transporter substrate-binding protein [Sporosarcina sp. PTS2304]